MKLVLKENWFTKRHSGHALMSTALVFLVMTIMSYWQLHGLEFAASGQSVFSGKEYWRLWSALLVHADLTHFLANTPLFLMFTYLLTSTFTLGIPLLALVVGGAMNALVLHTMPEQVHLLGVSGIVHMLGALWVTLHLLINRRDKFKVRFGSALFLVMMLFVPESYRPEVSYLSHFLGFIMGIGVGGLIYLMFRSRFKMAERWVLVHEPEPDFDWSGDDVISAQFTHVR